MKWNKSKTALFGHISKKTAHQLLGAWLLLTHVRSTAKPKNFKKIHPFINLAIKVWARRKCHLTWDNFMVHDVNKAPQVTCSIHHLVTRHAYTCHLQLPIQTNNRVFTQRSLEGSCGLGTRHRNWVTFSWDENQRKFGRLKWTCPMLM